MRLVAPVLWFNDIKEVLPYVWTALRVSTEPCLQEIRATRGIGFTNPELFCDPQRVLRRKLDMLTQTTHPARTSRPLAFAKGSFFADKKRINIDAKEDSLAPAQKPDRMAWVNQMVAIRDQKDRSAFADIFAHFAPRVKGFLMKSGITPGMAEEISQDVMATLWRKSHLFDPTKASVSTWIFTIARNRKIDVLRKQRRPEPEDLGWGPEEEPDQADVLALQQESAQLGKALAELPDKQRDLIVRAYYGELTHSEIAEETGLPLGTIKSRIRLALNRLRHQLK